MATTPPGDYAQISPLCDRRMAPVVAHAKSGASVQLCSDFLRLHYREGRYGILNENFKILTFEGNILINSNKYLQVMSGRL